MSIENPGRIPDRYIASGNESMDGDTLPDIESPDEAAGEDIDAEYTPDVRLPGTLNRLMQFIESDNIATLLSEQDLLDIGKKVTDDYDLDKDSCAEWYEANRKGLELAKQVSKHKAFPWDGAANVVVPLVTSAAIAYNARVYPEIIRDGGIAKTRIVGKDDGSKAKRAERVQNHLNYQLLIQSEEWEEDTDKLLMVYAVSGVAYRKWYYDPTKSRNCSTILTPDQVIVNNGIKSLATSRRISHVIEMFGNDIETKKRTGQYLDVELHVDTGQNEGDKRQPDDDPVYRIIEQHRWLDLDNDGLEEPYSVTVEKESGKVLCITARFDERDVVHKDDGMVVAVHARNHFVDYHFVPSFDGTFLSYGFGALIGNLNRASNSALNALLNAGVLSNTQGGFLAKNFRMSGGNKPIAPGEWRKTEIPAEILQQSLLPLPAKEPSQVLAGLLDKLIQMAQSIVAVQSIGLDQMPANAAASSVLSVIEQQSKVFNATFKRMYRSLTKELRLVAEMNKRYLDDSEYFRINDSEEEISRDDYATDDFDVIPVADPTITTQAQRMAIANTTFEVAKSVPGSNLVEAGRNVLKAIGNADPDQIIPASGEQTIPPEVQQQLAALQQQAAQAQQMLQQAGQEMAALNIMLMNKNKENAIKAFEALTKADIGQSQIAKNLADAKAKGDNAAIAAYEAQLFAVDRFSKSLAEIVNANGNIAGREGMAGAPGNAATPAAVGYGSLDNV